MRRLAGPMAERTGRVKREVAVLVALVVLVDGLFIAGYFVAGVARAPDTTKLGAYRALDPGHDGGGPPWPPAHPGAARGAGAVARPAVRCLLTPV